jgi:hypothetical protein
LTRCVFYDSEDPNPNAPTLGYPGPEVSRRVPNDWSVWAFADIHGMLTGLAEALLQAGLTDLDGRWIAPAQTALVGVGDYIDRGPDSAGVVEMLGRLSVEAEAGGSAVVLVRGNHEQMLSDILRGDPEWLPSWLDNGGRPTLASYSVAYSRSVGRVAAELKARDPGLLDWLLGTLPYAVWRDVVFVHAAPIVYGRLSDLDQSDVQLWNSEGLTGGSGMSHARYAGYAAEGIRRVVVGHIPQDEGPTIRHRGSTMFLDANACGLRRDDGKPRSAYACLARLAPEGDLGRSTVVRVDTRMPRPETRLRP